MRTVTYYACCLLLLAFIIVLVLAFTSPAHAAPQALPHTVAGGPCELWEAKYKQDPSALGWVHFQDVTVRGYRSCDDCAAVGDYAIAHFTSPGTALMYYCVMRPQQPGQRLVIWAGGMTK